MVENLQSDNSGSFDSNDLAAPALPADDNAPRPVGAHLKDLQDRLIELGTKLMRETDPEATDLISKALKVLQGQRLSVCVIGQVNAGKTTLVNALARRSNLLPVSQAPWTAVTTRLHFGLHGFPEQSAYFRFFDDKEWRRLAEQGGKLRELAERFLPGFNAKQLQQQIQVMRHRAQARLGSAFDGLLGSTHSFDSLEPEVVAQYVSAGPDTTPAPGETQPNYSDITRSADLFFELAPFGYPLTLIDTPGTNDPFLVREEMTLRSLDASNACVVVVDATKGVTDADLGLFRILRGVSTERLILFINKIDLLKGTAEHASSVAEQIAATVFEELGSKTIPVIVGNAQQASEHDQDRSFNRATSGLEALEAALSSLIHNGHSAHYVHQASATLTALADGVRSLAASQIAELQSLQEANKAQFDDQVQSARAMAFKQDLVKQIERTTGTAVASLKEIGSTYEERALANLRDLVEDYAASTRDEFLKQHPTSLPTKSIRFDVTDLRRKLLAAHTHESRHVRRAIQNSIRVASARLMFLMNQVENDAKISLDFNSLADDFVFPSQAPLGQALAIDLEEPFWKRWWRRRSTSKEAAHSLENLIVQEFLPVVDELVKNNKNELEKEIDYSALQLSINGTNLIQSMQNKQITVRSTSKTMPAVVDLELTSDITEPPNIAAKTSPTVAHQSQYRFDIAKSRHRRADALVRELETLTSQCQNLIGTN
jgi:GTP-binding protein EngB required for normal cell division